ncbi:MAG: mechanosensitive ion channel [Oscillospiraceae bacterium]
MFSVFALNLVSSKVFSYKNALLTAKIIDILIAFAKSCLIFIVGYYIINLAVKILKEFLLVSKIQTTLHAFILSATKIFLLILLTMISLEALGISTSSLVAALASAGLAISLSVKDHLSNLIGGVVILMAHPFKENDFVDINGTEGIVSEIGLIYTVLKSFDNKTIFMPNNDTAKAKIINHSSEKNRRLDMTFSIGYDDDYEKAKEIIFNAAKATGFVLDSPAPYVRMSGHGASSINISCRLWTMWENYYELSALMNETVKAQFDKNSINIPFNQMDVHIIPQK